MIKLSFERGSTDALPLVITGEWFQITYRTIRDSDGNDIAVYDNGFWCVHERYFFSDVVISTCLENDVTETTS